MSDGGMNAGQLCERLERHYIDPGKDLPGGIFLTEVQAPSAPRRIDALHLGFTRSRGHLLQGHEIKVSRSDWMTELRDASKAEAWWVHCHKWWVVAPSQDIVRPEELPHGWGLMVVNPKSRVRLTVVVESRLNPAPDIGIELLLEVTKKLDTMRADQVMAAVTRAREQDRKERAAAVSPPRLLPEQTGAQLTVDALADALDCNLPGSRRKRERPTPYFRTVVEVLGQMGPDAAANQDTLRRVTAKLTNIQADAQAIVQAVTETREKL
jgi:hypothetical protein